MKKRTKLLSLAASSILVVSAIGASTNKSVLADEQDVYPEATVEINETNFPDDAFRGYVKKNIDTDDNGILSDSEISQTKEVAVYEMSIHSLKGIEYLSSVEMLYCQQNELVELDLRQNTNLKRLDCSQNHITQLLLPVNGDFYSLDCESNELESLDLAGRSVSERLNLDINRFTSLDLSTSSIVSLSCQVNKLTSIKLPDNLESLECSDNNLKSLDVSYLTKLQDLSCSYNDIEKLDLTKNTSLKYLACMHNKLLGLDVSNLSSLLALFCDGNELTDSNLNLGSHPGLCGLSISNNSIASFDVQGYPNIITAIKKGERREFEGGYIEYCYAGENVFYQFVYDKTTVLIGLDEPTPTPAPAKGSIADFVERLYTVALGRASEKDGKEFWIQEITSGNKTGADCGLFFLTSEEFNNRGLSIENFVETLYKTFFGRDSEPNGKAYWVGELKSGRKSRADVIWGFIDSKEWCNICADYGVRSGAPTAKADYGSQNAIDFATRLYTCCLGRGPEDAGLRFWSLALTNLEKTGAEAAQLFFESLEFAYLLLDDREYITRLYTTFMDRQPEEEGMNYWLGEMKKGKTRREVMAWFAQSPEFTDICKKYGIARGEVNMNAPLPPKPSVDLKDAAEGELFKSEVYC